jgi:hypothetical protein
VLFPPERSSIDFRGEEWRLLKVVWTSFCAALCPVDVNRLAEFVTAFKAHLARYSDYTPTQRHLLRRLIGDDPPMDFAA